MKRSAIILSAALLLVGTGQVEAGVLVSPNGQAAVEGNSNNGFPFNIANFSLTSQRYQQVYNASDFSAFGGTARLITQIAFRPDAFFGGAFSSTLSSIQIDLSTTAASADSLSSTFANNVGGNDTTVFSGALSLSSADTGPVGGPKDFDIVITLQTPFLYDPTAGNLLLDVHNFGGGMTTQFDSEKVTGDSVSRVVTTSSGVGSPTADISDSEGLITQFTFGPAAVAPEPASLTLLGLGVSALAGYGWRRRATA
jgi:hypothetical protein